jgi:hypothetical protein
MLLKKRECSCHIPVIPERRKRGLVLLDIATLLFISEQQTHWCFVGSCGLGSINNVPVNNS